MENISSDLFSSFQPNTFMVFGLFLLLGVLSAILGNRIKGMPTITSFMILGLIAGPYGLGLVTKPVLQAAYVLIDVALGLILYKLGNMLHPKAMIKSKKLMIISLSETFFTFVCMFVAVMLLGYGPALSALIAAIGVSSSPAVLVHVAEELHAKGPVTERSKSLVAMNNLFSFMIFSMVLPFAMTNAEQTLTEVIFLPVYRLLGAAAVGIAVAWVSVRMVKMLRPWDQHYRFAIIIGAVMTTLGLCGMLHMSSLLAPLILGIATRWFETSKHNLSKVGLGEGGDLFFIVLFVMAGAKIDPGGLLDAGFAVIFLVIMRCVGKVAGIFFVMPHMGFEKTQSTATSLLLIPMAGMAIGLVATTSSLVPEMGVKIATIVFAMVAVFETIGPFGATKAFYMAGEAEEDSEDEEGGGAQPQQSS
jgi:Kef-type K+ transport system membrane component KefB